MSADGGHRRSPSPRDRGRSRSRSPRRRGFHDSASPSRCLGVFGLNVRTTELELEKAFSRVAQVERVNLVMDRRSTSSRGFAFIYFTSVEEATRAKEAMGGKDLDGRTMRVDYSLTKRAHTPTPGQYMGRRSPSRHDRQRRSPSPRHRRLPSPHHHHHRYARPSPPPYRRRSPSPYYHRPRRSPSPYYDRRRSPSPYYRRRSPPPYYSRRSPSPYRGRY